jgi:dihydroorotase
MTKFWMLGMPIEEIVMRCTSIPARKMGLDAGTLRVGSPADIAVLAIDEEPVSFVDCTGEHRVCDRRLSASYTYCSGVRLDPDILGVTEDLPVEISSRPMGSGS